MAQAALGAQLKVETLDGPEELTVPPGCPTGQELRLPRPRVSRISSAGAVATCSSPWWSRRRRSSRRAQEDLLRRFAAERGEDVAPPEAGLFSRIRSAFK